MKCTGIVRQLDNLGRMVLPAELREKLDIQPGELLKIYIDEDEGKIIFEKFQRACVFCDSNEANLKFKGKIICKTCLHKILEE